MELKTLFGSENNKSIPAIVSTGPGNFEIRWANKANVFQYAFFWIGWAACFGILVTAIWAVVQNHNQSYWWLVVCISLTMILMCRMRVSINVDRRELAKGVFFFGMFPIVWRTRHIEDDDSIAIFMRNYDRSHKNLILHRIELMNRRNSSLVAAKYYYGREEMDEMVELADELAKLLHIENRGYSEGQRYFWE